MKIEPRNFKKSLKYMAVGACVATTIVSTGCDGLIDEILDTLPIDIPKKIEETEFMGIVAPPPNLTFPPKHTSKPYEKEEVPTDENEATPELAGAIPTPEREVELSGDIAFDDELATAGAPPQ